MFIGYYKKYPIYISNRKNKKYYAIVDDKKVHFGDNRYEQYYDKMHYYSHLNHFNNTRRKNYYSRHGRQAKEGSAKWFSHKILW